MKNANSAVASVSDVGSVREGDFVFVCIRAVDVVEPDGDLRHDLQRPLPCFEHFGIDRITECRDQAGDAALHFLDDQFFWRRLRALKNLKIITVLAQPVLGGITNARCRKDAETFFVAHG